MYVCMYVCSGGCSKTALCKFIQTSNRLYKSMQNPRAAKGSRKRRGRDAKRNCLISEGMHVSVQGSWLALLVNYSLLTLVPVPNYNSPSQDC